MVIGPDRTLISKGLRHRAPLEGDNHLSGPCPDIEGIKTRLVGQDGGDQVSGPCPDIEGIKTRQAAEVFGCTSPDRALISKGLRPPLGVDAAQPVVRTVP